MSKMEVAMRAPEPRRAVVMLKIWVALWRVDIF